MVKETMNIHKALSELKVLDSRILKAISESTYCLANKASNDKVKGISLDDYKTIMTAGYDKATDLINRRNAIKRAIVKRNATTKVLINGALYTVAEAIEIKNTGIDYDKTLLATLTNQYNSAQKIINRENTNLDERAEQFVTGLYSSKEKTSPDDFAKVKNEFRKSNEFLLVDPLDILKKISDLENKIDTFESEVDSALSVSNALTIIDVEY